MNPMMIFKEFALLLSLLCCLPACDNDSPGDKPGGGEDPGGNAEIQAISPYNRVIYEVNVRNYSATGDFKGVEQDLPRLKELGVDILWLMPIHPIGEVNRNGTLGSPYAVKDYKAAHPDFGTLDDLRAGSRRARSGHGDLARLGSQPYGLGSSVGRGTSGLLRGKRRTAPLLAGKLDGCDPARLRQRSDVPGNDRRHEILGTGSRYRRVPLRRGDVCAAGLLEKAHTEVNRIKEITWLAEGDDPAYMEVFDLDYAWEFCGRLYRFG